MLSIANFIRRLKSPFNYNIGFVDITPAEFIEEEGFGKRKIEWMKHRYNDRWFADPFIVGADDDKIIVLAEEKQYGIPGSLVQLTVSQVGKYLIDRVEILKLPTHLSYPNPIEYDGKTYIYPENSQSGKLSIYEYSNGTPLKLITTLIDKPLNDSSIVINPKDGRCYLIATSTDLDPHNQTLIFEAESIMGKWAQVSGNPIITDNRYARPGGNFFRVKDSLYRPAQDCACIYGNSLHIMKVDSLNPWSEQEAFHLKPSSYKYSKGLHTLNFHDSGIAVIDGNGYAYPFVGRILGPVLERMIHPSK